MSKGETTSNRALLIPGIFLLLGLTLTYFLQGSAREAAREALHDEFKFRVSEVLGNIDRRLQSYEQILESTAGLFAASD